MAGVAALLLGVMALDGQIGRVVALTGVVGLAAARYLGFLQSIRRQLSNRKHDKSSPPCP